MMRPCSRLQKGPSTAPTVNEIPVSGSKEQDTVDVAYEEILQTQDADAKRFRAYKYMTRILFGYLGANHRKPLPYCAVEGIKCMWPDLNNTYIGYLAGIAPSAMANGGGDDDVSSKEVSGGRGD